MCSKSLAGLKNYRGWSPRLVTAAGHRGLLRTPANRGDSYGGEGEGVERNSGSSSLRAPILKGRFFARTNQIW